MDTAELSGHLTFKGGTSLSMRPDLLESVVHNKSIMFADNSASYETAALGSLRLLARKEGETQLRQDYAAMSDMFMTAPPSLEALLKSLAALEAKINSGS